MSRYVEPTDELVIEVLGRNIWCSVAFYRRFGFEVIDGFGVRFATRLADGVKR